MLSRTIDNGRPAQARPIRFPPGIFISKPQLFVECSQQYGLALSNLDIYLVSTVGEPTSARDVGQQAAVFVEGDTRKNSEKSF
jgi:hypothetical protein